MYLLLDIGGTHTRVATSDGEKLNEPQTIDTPKDFNEAISGIKKIADQLTGGEKIQAVAGGVRALDKEKLRLRPHPRFPLWVGEPLHDRLEEVLGTPVYLENDAALAGLGEATHGAGAGHKIVVYLTISTGVGGVKIENGKIDENSMGFEPGHLLISGGFLEDFASGIGIEKKYGQKPEDLDDPQAWEEISKNLAAGLNNCVVLWSPDIIVLGGGVVGKLDITKLEQYLRDILTIYPESTPIVKASLADKSGLYGALEYLKQVQS